MYIYIYMYNISYYIHIVSVIVVLCYVEHHCLLTLESSSHLFEQMAVENSLFWCIDGIPSASWPIGSRYPMWSRRVDSWICQTPENWNLSVAWAWPIWLYIHFLKLGSSENAVGYPFFVVFSSLISTWQDPPTGVFTHPFGQIFTHSEWCVNPFLNSEGWWHQDLTVLGQFRFDFFGVLGEFVTCCHHLSINPLVAT
jgi:hypothetical protein